MKLEKRLDAFIQLGRNLSTFFDKKNEEPERRFLEDSINQADYENPWFTRRDIEHALAAIGQMLKEEELIKWTEQYPSLSLENRNPRKIGLVMAGNIPAVGFHDLLCVLMAGHTFKAKLSSQDNILLPALADMLCKIEPAFGEMTNFVSNKLEGFDAVIATGSNNSARYFEHYFGKYPSIIRKNRTGVAVLDGNESDAELEKLADDIFLYFGLGCRNVSKLYFPENNNLNELLIHFQNYSQIIDNHKYRNNYDYFKSIYLINREKFWDSGFVLMKEDARIASPVSVIFFEKYTDPSEVSNILAERKEEIQCIVGSGKHFSKFAIPFGTTQYPGLMDYADGIDSMEFLLSLK